MIHDVHTFDYVINTLINLGLSRSKAEELTSEIDQNGSAIIFDENIREDILGDQNTKAIADFKYVRENSTLVSSLVNKSMLQNEGKATKVEDSDSSSETTQHREIEYPGIPRNGYMPSCFYSSSGRVCTDTPMDSQQEKDCT